jgi:hypothetical protein
LLTTSSTGPRTSLELATALVQAVSHSESPAVGAALIEALPNITPAVRGEVMRVLLGVAWLAALWRLFARRGAE